MSLRRLLTESAQFVAVGVISIFLAVIGINAVGFLIAEGTMVRKRSGRRHPRLLYQPISGPACWRSVAIAWMSYLKKRKK